MTRITSAIWFAILVIAAGSCRMKTPEYAPPSAPPSVHALVEFLQWATVTADYASDRATHDKFKISGMSAREIFEAYYANDVAGGYCGGTAIFTFQALVEAGFNAAAVGIGKTGSPITHVTNLVEIEGEIYLVDATFGAYLSDEAGAPLALRKALGGRPYQMQTIPQAGRRFLVQSAPPSSLVDCVPTTDGMSCDLPGFGWQSYLRDNREALEKAGYAADDTLLLEMLRAEINAFRGDPAIRAKVEAMLAGVP